MTITIYLVLSLLVVACAFGVWDEYRIYRCPKRRRVTTKNPNLEQLDKMAWEQFDRPFVELDADCRKELESELNEQL